MIKRGTLGKPTVTVALRLAASVSGENPIKAKIDQPAGDCAVSIETRVAADDGDRVGKCSKVVRTRSVLPFFGHAAHKVCVRH